MKVLSYSLSILAAAAFSACNHGTTAEAPAAKPAAPVAAKPAAPAVKKLTPAEMRANEISEVCNFTLPWEKRIAAFKSYCRATNRTKNNKTDFYRMADLLLKEKACPASDRYFIHSNVWTQANYILDNAKRIPHAEAVFQSADFTAVQRLAAATQLVEAYYVAGDKAKALKTAQDAQKIPDLKEKTLYEAYALAGKYHSINSDLDKAIAAYRVIGAKDKSPAAQNYMYEKIVAECKHFHEPERALKELKGANRPSLEIEFLQRCHRTAEARAAAKKVLESDAAPGVKAQVLQQCFLDPSPESFAIREKYKELFKHINALTLFFRAFSPAHNNGHFEVVLQLAPHMLAKGSHNTYVYHRLAIVHSYRNDFAEVVKTMDAALADKKLSVADRFKFRLIQEVARSKNPIKDLPKIYDTVCKEFADKKLTMEQKSQGVLAMSGVFAVNQQMADLTFALDKFYQGLYVARPQNEYVIRYSPQNAHSYSDWQNLKEKPAVQLLKWKYGGSMDFLVTDVSTGNRGAGIGSETGNQENHTELSAVCDDHGILFILRAYDDRAREVEAGTLGAGCYEIYLAAGENQPYHCLLPQVDGSEFTVWTTTYTNRTHRNLMTKDVRGETIFHADGYTNCFFIPWEAYYDKLPEQKEQYWEADFVHWGRRGGYSWNALQSIHSRSSWGKLRFEIPPEGLKKIREKLIVKAMRKYNSAKNLNFNKPLALWQDDYLGDPEFYNAEIKPLVEKLDSYTKLVDFSKGMDAATVEKLWLEAVPMWNEIEYIVAEKRRLWMEKELFSDTAK